MYSSGNVAYLVEFSMKTMSYVEAVKLAVKKMEDRESRGIDGYFWVNRWRMYMIITPTITNHREI